MVSFEPAVVAKRAEYLLASSGAIVRTGDEERFSILTKRILLGASLRRNIPKDQLRRAVIRMRRQSQIESVLHRTLDQLAGTFGLQLNRCAPAGQFAIQAHVVLRLPALSYLV